MNRLIIITICTGLLVACSDRPQLLGPDMEIRTQVVEISPIAATPDDGTAADAAIQDALERILPEFGTGAAASRMSAALKAVSERLAEGRDAALGGSVRAAEAALENLARSAGAGMEAEIEVIRLALEEAGAK